MTGITKEKSRHPDFLIAPLEVVQDHRLTLMQTRILLSLLSFRNKQTNTVFPKREALAERAGYSVGIISRTTTQLVKLGWLKKLGDGGKRRASNYEIIVPDLTTQTVTDSVTVTEPVTVTDSDTQTVTEPVTPRVTESVRGNKEQTKGTDKGTDNNKNLTKKTANPSTSSQVENIFRHWQTTMGKTRARLTDDRKKLIGKALKQGYSLEDIKLAVYGCSLSQWNMGANDRQTAYNDLDIILRSAKSIERFMDIADRGGAKAGKGAEIDSVSDLAINEWLSDMEVGDGNMIEGEVVR